MFDKNHLDRLEDQDGTRMLSTLKYLESYGFSVDKTIFPRPGDPPSFKKDNFTVWAAPVSAFQVEDDCPFPSGKIIGWILAASEQEHYVGHRKFYKLSSAIEAVLELSPLD